MIKSIIAGVGSALPKHVLTNDDLSKMVDTSDEWITERTGIKQRHIAGDDETTRSLATLPLPDREDDPVAFDGPGRLHAAVPNGSAPVRE